MILRLLTYAFTAAFLAYCSYTYAQTDQPGEFFITWTAGTYVPADYAGKAIPTDTSTIRATFLAMRDGVPIDITREMVYWYVDDELVASGIGQQAVLIPVPAYPPKYLTVRVTLPNAQIEPSSKTVAIPITSPKAVIETPAPHGRMQGNTVRLRAVPYFFDVASASDLLYYWLINNQPPSTTNEPRLLDVDATGAQPLMPVDIRLGIQDPRESTVTTGTGVQLITPQQPN